MEEEASFGSALARTPALPAIGARTGRRPRPTGRRSRASRPTFRAARTDPHRRRRRCYACGDVWCASWRHWSRGETAATQRVTARRAGLGQPRHALMVGIRRPRDPVRARVCVRRLLDQPVGCRHRHVRRPLPARRPSGTRRAVVQRARRLAPRHRVRQLLPRPIGASGVRQVHLHAGGGVRRATDTRSCWTAGGVYTRLHAVPALRERIDRSRHLGAARTARTRSTCSPRTHPARAPGAARRRCGWTTTRRPRRLTWRRGRRRLAAGQLLRRALDQSGRPARSAREGSLHPLQNRRGLRAGRRANGTEPRSL